MKRNYTYNKVFSQVEGNKYRKFLNSFHNTLTISTLVYYLFLLSKICFCLFIGLENLMSEKKISEMFYSNLHFKTKSNEINGRMNEIIWIRYTKIKWIYVIIAYQYYWRTLFFIFYLFIKNWWNHHLHWNEMVNFCEIYVNKLFYIILFYKFII